MMRVEQITKSRVKKKNQTKNTTQSDMRLKSGLSLLPRAHVAKPTRHCVREIMAV